MSYLFIEEIISVNDYQGDRLPTIVAKFECDTESDLPARNQGNYIVGIGSYAHVVQNNATYRSMSDGTWVLSVDGTATYSKSEIDSMLNDKQDTLVIDSVPTAGSDNVVRSGGILNWVYGTPPEQIPEDADLNDYYNVGVYRATSGALAQTLINCPTTSSFRLEVVSSISAASQGYQIQRLYPNNSNGEFFMRRRLSAGSGNWAPWFRFAGVQV